MIIDLLFPSLITILLVALVVIKLARVNHIPGNKALNLLESLRFHGVAHSPDRKVIEFFRKSDGVNKVMYTLIGTLILVFFVLKNIA